MAVAMAIIQEPHLHILWMYPIYYIIEHDDLDKPSSMITMIDSD